MFYYRKFNVFNPFISNARFIYLLKTSGNFTFFMFPGAWGKVPWERCKLLNQLRYEQTSFENMTQKTSYLRCSVGSEYVSAPNFGQLRTFRKLSVICDGVFQFFKMFCRVLITPVMLYPYTAIMIPPMVYSLFEYFLTFLNNNLSLYVCISLFNPFQLNVLFQYPLKASENQKRLYDLFRRYTNELLSQRKMGQRKKLVGG